MVAAHPEALIGQGRVKYPKDSAVKSDASNDPKTASMRVMVLVVLRFIDFSLWHLVRIKISIPTRFFV